MLMVAEIDVDWLVPRELGTEMLDGRDLVELSMVNSFLTALMGKKFGSALWSWLQILELRLR